MTQDQALLLAFKIAVPAMQSAALLWVAVYTYLAKWWANPIGSTVTRLALELAAALIPSDLSLYLHLNRQTSRVTGWFDAAIFALIAIELLLRIPQWVHLHTDRAGRHPYAGMLPFLRQVIARRGRPIWKDWPEPDPGTGSPAETGDAS